MGGADAGPKDGLLSEPCLHCYITQAIVKYHQETGSHDFETGCLILDSENIVTALADVLSDVVARNRADARAVIVEEFNATLMDFVEKRLTGKTTEPATHMRPN